MKESSMVWQVLQRCVWCCGIILLLPALVFASAEVAAEGQSDEKQPPRLRSMELEQLLNMEVSTVSRTQSTVGESSAAVSVITHEDIRRSGATTIAELLRRVPGMDVARVDNNKWAITARGFNDRLADLLLVQMDGRTLYNPLFAGVYWDTVAYPLEDIERIEVIRGPGASVWGANAVNGIINIITKSAKDTQGGMVAAGGGNMERGFGTLRYGGAADGKAWYRVYGEGFDRLKNEYSTGPINDRWYVGDLGVRVDWEPSKKNTFLLDGQYLHGRTGYSDVSAQPTPPYSFRNLDHELTDAGHLLGRWTHTMGKDADVALQLYWDHVGREFQNIQERLRWDTYDLDWQHNLPLGDRHKFTYGLGYRLVDASLPPSDLDDGFIYTWDSGHRMVQLFSGFVQDRIVLIKDRLSILLGTKLEHNDFTGFEVQPTGRLLWTPTERQSAWFAVSRAVRTPSLLEDSLIATVAPISTSPVVIFPRIIFNKEFKAEEVIAYELGYRAQPEAQFSVDVALFYNDYENLRIAELLPPTAGPGGTTILPVTFDNRMTGDTYGAELTADWHPANWWRLYAAYTFLEMRLHPDPSLPPLITASAEANEGHSPQHQVYLQSSWNVWKSVEFDLIGRYVSKLTGFNTGNAPGIPGTIDAYGSMDLRLAWQPLKDLELSVVGQNLLDDHHAEWAGTPVAEIRRSVYGRVKWTF